MRQYLRHFGTTGGIRLSDRWHLTSTSSTYDVPPRRLGGVDVPASITATFSLEGDPDATATANYLVSDAGVRCEAISAERVPPLDLTRFVVVAESIAAAVLRHVADAPLLSRSTEAPRTDLARQLERGPGARAYELRLAAIAYCEPGTPRTGKGRRNPTERVRTALGLAPDDNGLRTASRRVAAARVAGLIPPEGASDDELAAAWSQLTGFEGPMIEHRLVDDIADWGNVGPALNFDPAVNSSFSELAQRAE